MMCWDLHTYTRLAGLSRAAASRGLPTQLCSDSARDVIASAALPAVTQFRGSLDFACDCGAEPITGNWDVGQQALLISSLGLGASKDTFMTSEVEAGINHGQAGGCPVNNGHVELDLFVATLSSGPVGFGDGIHDTNRTLLMRCCAEDGKILRADTASTPIDATWAQSPTHKLPAERNGASGQPKATAAVWTASTTRNGSSWHFVTAIDVPTSFVLQPPDLWPVPTSAASVLHRRWHALECVDGQAASLCGVQLGLPDVSTGIPTNRCQNKTQDNRTCTWRGAHNWELTAVVPVTRSGVALLGELNKVVSVSSARFGSVVTLRDGMRVTVRGTPGEKVELTFVVGAFTPQPTIRVASVTIPASGEATVTINPAGGLVEDGTQQIQPKKLLHQFTRDGAFKSDDKRLTTTVSTARISVVLDGLGISRIDVHMPGGNTTIRLRSLPGSGTQMEDCTVIQTSTGVVLGGVQLTRVVKCRPNEYHDVGGATASVVDTFTAAINGPSIMWTTNISSTSQAAWSTPIVACLGWASWDKSSRAWLGGPREMLPVSLKYDPLAPFPLENTTASFSRLYYGGELPTQSTSCSSIVATILTN